VDRRRCPAGVTRQAARQRFADRPAGDALPYAARTVPRLQACLDSAVQQARAEGAEEIGTQHLLAGLMAEGVAAAILENLHVSAEAIRGSSHHDGVEFGASFHWHLLDKGIDHVKIKPRTPRLNGKVERSHRIDSEEFYRLLQGHVIDDANLFSEKRQEWEDYYNYHRPRGALGGQTPYERLRQKAQDPLS
jgi:hypothetical protein